MATALAIASGRSGGDDRVDARRLREIRRELLEVLRTLAPCVAPEPHSDNGVPRTRHLRAASLLPYPARSVLALETLLEILVRPRLGADSRSRLSSTETVQGAAEDLRAAAAVLHRLEPRPPGRAIAQLAALAADLHRIARGSAAASISRSSPAS